VKELFERNGVDGIERSNKMDHLKIIQGKWIRPKYEKNKTRKKEIILPVIS
jgi:hypothetical protein